MQQENDSLNQIMKIVTAENNSLRSQLIAECEKSSSLKRHFKSWSMKTEGEVNQLRARIQELDELLTKERLRSCKYEKKVNHSFSSCAQWAY